MTNNIVQDKTLFNIYSNCSIDSVKQLSQKERKILQLALKNIKEHKTTLSQKDAETLLERLQHPKKHSPSNVIVKFFKGIANFFGWRISSKSLETEWKGIAINYEVHRKEFEQLESILVEKINQDPTHLTLSDEDIDGIFQLIQNNRDYLERQGAVKKLHEALIQEFGEKFAKEALAIPGLIPDKFKDSFQVWPQQLIAHILEKCRNYYHNQNTLERIKSQIGSKNSSRILDEVLKTIEIQPYLTGIKKISQETENYILACARKLVAEENWEELITKLKESSARDLYLDESFIDQHFAIPHALEGLTEDQKKEKRDVLRGIINKAYLKRELIQKGKVSVGREGEKELLVQLGFDVGENSNYMNKAFIHEMVQNIVIQQLQLEEYKGPLNILRETFEKVSFHSRLKTVGIESDTQIAKFEIAHKRYLELHEEAVAYVKQPEFQWKIPENFPLSSDSEAIIALNRGYEKGLLQIAKDETNKQFPKGMGKSVLENMSIEEFTSKISKTKLKKKEILEWIISLILDKKTEEEFYQKFGTHLVASAVQGLRDIQEVFLDGVCWGLCTKILLEFQKKNQVKLHEIVSEIRVKGINRFLQSLGIISLRIANGRQELPVEILQKHGFSSNKRLFTISRNPENPDNVMTTNEFKNHFFDRPEVLARSNGWIGVSFGGNDWGHIILMRHDPDMKVSWLYDPNFGLFSFEDPDDNQRALMLMDCYTQILESFYPSTLAIYANQMV